MNYLDTLDSTQAHCPFLTADLPGLGGQYKTRRSDFLVEEVPLYPLSGQGTHLFIFIEKQGLSTMDAIVQIARALKRSPRDIGYAGLKDAHAVTRQWLSVEHISPDDLHQLPISQIRILQSYPHHKKLKIGHLLGNRFTILLRDIQIPLDQALLRAQNIMDRLDSIGVPNYYGPQRFGKRKDSHLLGRAIVHNDAEQFIDLLLGRPLDTDQPAFYNARICYEKGDYEQAYNTWPPHFYDHRRTLRALTLGKNKQQAFQTIDKRYKRLYVSAFQSDLFNQVLSCRMPQIDSLFQGDIAWKHKNGACFRVENQNAEQPRCQTFEISPTGPMFGKQMIQPTGDQWQIEQKILEEADMKIDDFQLSQLYKSRGGRRALRFRPRQLDLQTGCDDLGPYLSLRFTLDPGCYATTLLREMTRQP